MCESFFFPVFVVNFLFFVLRGEIKNYQNESLKKKCELVQTRFLPIWNILLSYTTITGNIKLKETNKLIKL